MEREYPHAWKLNTDAVISRDDARALCCGHNNCVNGYETAGGLVNISAADGAPNWRCIKHREAIEPSPHRLDLRQAHERDATAKLRKILDVVAAGITTLSAERAKLGPIPN